MLLALACVRHAIPDSLVRLHEHSPIRAGQWHAVVAHIDLAAPQQRLPAHLKTLVQDGQQEHAQACAHHF